MSQEAWAALLGAVASGIIWAAAIVLAITGWTRDKSGR